MHLPEGTILQNGKYKIVRFINSGGFGCTYEGVQTMMGARIAIKEFFVNDFCNRDNDNTVSVGTKSKVNDFQRLKKSFVKEAIALFYMQHPHIVRVIDVFEENGTAYYVMDYIDGGSLSDIVKQKGKLSEPGALGYIKQVCDALKYVHSQNRLHLDIKPANVMVDKSGKAVLIDFGTSKYYDQETGEQTSTLLGVLTKAYAPLELMQGSFNTFNPAADIYSLGATLYKLLTGITPPPALDLLTKKGNLQPLPANISDSTRKALAFAMQIDNDQRPQSIEEFESILFAPTTIGDDEKTTLDNGEVSKPNPIHKEQVKTEKKDIKANTEEETHFDVPNLKDGIEEFKEWKEKLFHSNKSHNNSTSEEETSLDEKEKKPSKTNKTLKKIVLWICGSVFALFLIIFILVWTQTEFHITVGSHTFFSGNPDKEAESLIKEREISSDGFINEHEYVDLGLPSGLLWATCNIGATSPEEYGYYFAWGDTIALTKENKERCGSPWGSRDMLLEIGYIDEEGNLTQTYDAANKNWGSSWRMPTKKDIDELLKHTTSQWTTIDGINGRLLTSKRNNKTMFLPAGGEWQGSDYRDNVGTGARYWSSTLRNPEIDEDIKQECVYDLVFYESYIACGWGPFWGEYEMVRPVSK